MGRRGLLPISAGILPLLFLLMFLPAQDTKVLLPQDAKAGDGWINSIGMKLIFCPAGEFAMGSPGDERMRQEEEVPHRVVLTRPFFLGSTEVTQKQWSALMEFDRSPEKGDLLPAVNLSWKDAQTFCRKLSEREGRIYRLPMEAEWEYACRAGKPWQVPDAGKLAESAWFADNSEEKPHPVGLKLPNAWQLHDMLGNVSEWCLDYLAPYPAKDVENPLGPTEGSARVVRGGSWRHFRPMLRPAARASAPESYQYPHLGFRVLLQTEPAKTPGSAGVPPAKAIASIRTFWKETKPSLFSPL